MKILMSGPGFGHNLQPFIEYFSSSTKHHLTFLYEMKLDFKEEENLNFVSGKIKSLNLFKLIRTIRKDYDLIWVHGGYNFWLLLLIFLITNNRQKIVVSLWGEFIPKSLAKDTLKVKFLKFIFKRIGKVHSNWFSVSNLLKENLSDVNVITKFWGVTDEILSPKGEMSEEARTFINGLDMNKYRFFYPKSFNSSAGHDLIIEACKKLVEKGVKDFIVYFWTGNDNVLFEKYSSLIFEKALQNNILIQKHSFLPFYDLFKIWEVMDCGLQIAKNDQLSTTFLEPQLFKKEIIATDIYPYRKYNEIFGSSLTLVSLDSFSISKRMESLIKGVEKTSSFIIEKRARAIKENFVFEKNIEFLLEEFTK